MAVKPIPDGMDSIIPHLVVNDAAGAIEFYKKAFGAQELYRMPSPDGKIMHAELRIHGRPLMLCDEVMGAQGPKGLGGSSVTMSMYVEDADAVFNQAVGAGATVQLPIGDQFWGDRYGKVVDPFGHQWAIMTHKEDLGPEEMMERAQKAFAGQPG